MLGKGEGAAERRTARRALEAVGRVLGEGTMGFLALLALALALTPVLFPLDPAVRLAFSAAGWAVVGLFGVEYVVHLLLAPRRGAYVRNPWRIVDLAIVVLPLLSLVPPFGRWFRSSPVLRLLRLFRIVLFGARVGGRSVARPTPRPEIGGEGPSRVSVVREETSSPRPAAWDQLLRWVAGSQGAWFHVSNLEVGRVEELADATDLPGDFLRTSLGEMVRPHLEVLEAFSALFLWIPSVRRGHPPELDRTGVVLITRPDTLITLSRRKAEIQKSVLESIDRMNLPEDAPFPTRMTYAFARLVLERYREVFLVLEAEVRSLEEVPAKDGGTPFFERAFGLDRALGQVKGDLWRLKDVFASIASGRVGVHGARKEDAEFLRTLSEEAESAYEQAASLRESLVSLMDLHMNVASFEMNRVMRVLAILSALGLFPAVVGGLLGMNLKDNPWPATLPQVAFGVFWGMLLALYIFYVKGWIR